MVFGLKTFMVIVLENSLKILSVILEKIRFDAEETNDIRELFKKRTTFNY